MKISSSKKNKIIIALGIAFVCTVLITAGIFKLVKDSKGESAVEVLEKSKISNLFNIRQAENDYSDENSSSRQNGGTSRMSTNVGNTISTSGNTGTQTTTTSKQNTLKKISPQVSTPNVQTPVASNPEPTVTSPVQTEPPAPNVQTAASTEETPQRAPQKAPTEEVGIYTITIDNAISGHTYDAYQIFTGDLYERNVTKEGKEVTEKVLSNIKWEKKFDDCGTIIINRLKSYYEENYKEEETFKNCKTAADVADILSKYEGLANQFSIIIGDIIKEYNITPTKSTVGDNYEITNLKEGYYIVIDSKIPDTDDSHSRYMLDVVSNVTLEIKSVKPTLRKEVSSKNIADNKTKNTATYYDEDENKTYEITFDLITTIPNNAKNYLTEYSKYDYTIIDVLDTGFELKTLPGSDTIDLTMKIGNNTAYVLETNYTVEKVVLTSESFGDLKEKYKLDGDFDYYKEKTILKITIPNLLTQINDESVAINPNDEVTFEYKARLNGEHNVGTVPNTTEAHLIYSANPHDSSVTSKTTKATTKTYSIDLKISKIAELERDKEPEFLNGAKFELYSSDDLEKPITTIEVNGTTNEEGIITSSNGIYSSLAAGTYYLKETKAPDGYNKLDDEIELTIEIGLKNEDVEWKVSKKAKNDKPKTNSLVHLTNEYDSEGIRTNGTVTDENGTYIALEVENTHGSMLPVTGGVGTIIFTVVGLSIMTVAVIALKPNKKEN